MGDGGRSWGLSVRWWFSFFYYSAVRVQPLKASTSHHHTQSHRVVSRRFNTRGLKEALAPFPAHSLVARYVPTHARLTPHVFKVALMLLAEKRKRQLVANKIGHEEYIYRLEGDPQRYPDRVYVRPQNAMDLRRFANHPHVQHRYQGPENPPYAVDGRDHDNRHAKHNGEVDGSQGGQLALQQGLARPGNYMQAAPVAGLGTLQPLGGGLIPSGGARPFSAMPALPPVSDLPLPFPGIYKPKPPLLFHGGGGVGVPSYAPPHVQAPLAPIHADGRASPLAISMSPVRNLAYVPYTSPERNLATPRPQTGPPLPPIGSVPVTQQRKGPGTNVITRANRPGMSMEEERYAIKMENRRVAQEFQAENIRHMEERERRRQEERQREIAEVHSEELRLRQEREIVARRELAELEREKQERQVRMRSPKIVTEQLNDQRAAEEAAQKLAQQEAARHTPAPPLIPPSIVKSVTPVGPPPPVPSVAPPSSLHLQPSAAFLPPPPTQPYVFPSLTPPAALQPAPLPVSVQHVCVPTTYDFEAESLRRELRSVSENQMRLEQIIEGQQRRAAMIGSAAPRSGSPAGSFGAGTYLTSGTNLRHVSPVAIRSVSPPADVGLGLGGGPLFGSYLSADGATSTFLRPPGMGYPYDIVPGKDLTQSTHHVRIPGVAPPIHVLASQVPNAASAFPSPRENPDLTMEPSKFVGRPMAPFSAVFNNTLSSPTDRPPAPHGNVTEMQPSPCSGAILEPSQTTSVSGKQSRETPSTTKTRPGSSHSPIPSSSVPPLVPAITRALSSLQASDAAASSALQLLPSSESQTLSKLGRRRSSVVEVTVQESTLIARSSGTKDEYFGSEEQHCTTGNK